VLVEWVTDKPYESVVQCSAPGCRLIGLNLSHTSPSVANNFAVYNQAGSLRDPLQSLFPRFQILKQIAQVHTLDSARSGCPPIEQFLNVTDF
jgi:hypothetical protein